ncbi:MAG: VWA domain-containing protein, partial [Planctomycetales bacterium]|nr:VWA domain-containing protein [Planctomycetales bacterium]
MRNRVAAGVACFVLLVGSNLHLRASEYPEVLFILDSSGSMAEDAGGERKIDAAKRVMHEVVTQLNPEVRVGLIAYGHRRAGDCQDIEVLSPAGSSDRGALLSQVTALEPRGKTPLSGAVLTAAEMLRTKDVVTSIVLVSDGLETCGGDPCQVVRELKATGCKFVLHTVGFNVDNPAAKQLACMAKGGAGRYFAASDGDQLLAALQEVSQEIAQQVEAAKVRHVVQKSGLGKFRITLPAKAVESLAYVEIVRAADGKVVKTIDGVKPDSTHPLVSGDYGIAIGFKAPNFQGPTRLEIGQVTIKREETRELALGSIAFNLPEDVVKHDDWKQRLHVDSVIIADSGSGREVLKIGSRGYAHYNFHEKPLLPGIYDVRFRYGTNTEAPLTIARRVVVKPGQRATVTLESGVQFAETQGKLAAWRLYRSPDASKSSSDTDPADGQRTLAFEARAFTGLGSSIDANNLHYPYLLPAGTFDLEVDVVGMTEPLPVAEGLEVKQGELLR